MYRQLAVHNTPLVYSRSSELLTCIAQDSSDVMRARVQQTCFSTFLLPGQPCMSWLDMHPQVQRAKFCNKFSRFSPSSAFGRASIALRRPAKANRFTCTVNRFHGRIPWQRFSKIIRTRRQWQRCSIEVLASNQALPALDTSHATCCY